MNDLDIKPWSSADNIAPAFGVVPNAIIEHICDRGYHLSVFWLDGYSVEPKLVMDVCEHHKIFPEFPGKSLGRVVYAPHTGEIEVSELYDYASPDHRKMTVDIANPDCFAGLDTFLLSLVSN